MKNLRWIIRIFMLAVFASLAILAGGNPVLQSVLPACSPLLVLLALAAGAAPPLLLPAGCVAFACALMPRFFCRWVCPAGTCFEAAGNAGGRLVRNRGRLKIPRLGMWILGIGLGASLAGYPLFLALDPMALFSSAFGWSAGPSTAWEIAGAAIFPVMLAVAAVAPWLWCGRLCPLGALQDALFEPRRIAVARTGPPRDVSARNIDAGRRLFIGLGVGAVYRLLLNPAAAHPRPRPVRPPASGSEARFTRLCARCGACVRACPGGIIRQGSAECGFSGVLAPELDFARGECTPQCNRCGRACPTGAIPAFSAEDKFDHPLGLAVLKRDLCVLTQDRECGICMNACPHRAISIRWDPVELTSVLEIRRELCTGCGVCQHVCPEQPVAIVVEAGKQ